MSRKESDVEDKVWLVWRGERIFEKRKLEGVFGTPGAANAYVRGEMSNYRHLMFTVEAVKVRA